ncbi:MAG TPA: PQQ-dependent sugar dehydrogenase [Rhodanobacteraceae bacterium]|jgi:glucose/arabinose dehydrogenase|nr:PQQ-dependent sugar dehydrogenase [Rhodanobacteraceae bacterium]
MTLRRSKQFIRSIFVLASAIAMLPACNSQTTPFHGAPAAEQARRNPYAASAGAMDDGKLVFASTCAACHGANGEGSAAVPALRSDSIRQASDGELFWYITRGDTNNGMPSWAALPEEKRWHVISYLRSIKEMAPVAKIAEPSAAAAITTPEPAPPFTDFRYEVPGKSRKITVADLPQPYATPSAGNGPRLVARPADALPKAPAGFKVGQFASAVPGPRLLRTAPNGDVFAALTSAGKIALFRGIGADGKAEKTSIFASGLNKPFGIAFYPPGRSPSATGRSPSAPEAMDGRERPPGPDPKWIYVGNTNAVVRFAYTNGDLEARGMPEHIADLPSGAGHSTRDIQFSPDGKTMYVSVGSASNVDDPDTTVTEKRRADILAFDPEGGGQRVFASGIRNAVGLAIQPQTGALWCSVNERDGLGDNLVPDYITHIEDGGFYGWPWWYIGAHQDPRHAGKRRDLMGKVIVPDVLLQPHNASLQLTFYDGAQFPADYRGDIFAAEHGSWNRATRAGYEVIRVPLHQSGHASGEYEDFLTGFVLDSGDVWGRPVGVTVASDGSLLVSDDGSNSIWRVSYAGETSAAPVR